MQTSHVPSALTLALLSIDRPSFAWAGCAALAVGVDSGEPTMAAYK